MKKLFTFLLVALLLSACADYNDSPKIDTEKELAAIQKNMDEQIECWNDGNIPCYMEHYWKSDSLLFVGKEGLTQGWQSTLDNYMASYPDKKNMGTLSFENKEMRFIDNETIQVIGAWNLEREEGLENLGGHYSLIWKKKNGKWVIITDHSS